MRHLIRNAALCIALLILFTWSIVPPEKKIRLGKDLRGGVSLVYSVQIRAGENPDEIIGRTIEVLKERVDPEGLYEISMIKRGRDRIEISMPLPGPEVAKLKKAFEEELSKLGRAAISPSRLDELMRSPAAERQQRIDEIAAGDADRAAKLATASQAQDQVQATRAAYEKAKAEAAPADRLEELLDAAAAVDRAYTDARDAVMRTALSSDDVRAVVQLSKKSRQLFDDELKQQVIIPSPRDAGLEKLRASHPETRAQLDKVVASYEAYEKSKTSLDDADELIRLLKGAGVLSFRIAVDPGQHAEEARLRQELRERGPRNVRSGDARWYKINRLESFYETVQDQRFLQAAPAQYFQSRYNSIVEEYNGSYYMLLWDTRSTRLTQADGNWSVSGAFEGRDQLGRPAINFQMNARGAVLLGALTADHVKHKMAVLLDDEVYTAPVLNSAISTGGMIEGRFSAEEIRYIIRVLSAGSLQAKLSPEPISRQNLSPELGADRLRDGLKAGVICFIVVSVFMVVYYFQLGVISVIALLANALTILGVMAMNKAAFTMPGIAGIVLTFGVGIDANVLIYERMREEFMRGRDLRTAVRLGFSKAMASIVDGNLSNLIICVVLGFTGTQEIKGFAITLGIGVAGTLFAALLVSRVIFTLFVDYLGWKRTSMLPLAVPAVQRALTWHIDWLRPRWVFLAIAVVMSIGSIGLAWYRGPAMLDTEFRGGTEVTLQFKDKPDGSDRITMTREQVLGRVRELAKESPDEKARVAFADAEVGVINARQDLVTSDTFAVKMPAADDKVVLAALAAKFSDVIETREAISFTGQEIADWRQAPVYRISSKKLGDSIDRPTISDDVSGFFGGVAIVLDNLQPPIPRESLQSRLQQIRRASGSAETVSRAMDVRVIGGTEDAVTSAVVLVLDENISFFDDEERWNNSVAGAEWKLVVDAVASKTQLASVTNFSPTIAATFKAQAVVSVFLSVFLLTVYVWVRFGAARWALAATLPLFHDVLAIIGCIAVAQILYDTKATNGFATAIGLIAFKIDLNMIAALLTIAGYSLNDTIIILDRIRENKGKLPYATYEAVNDGINQTMSRSVITHGTTLISSIVLYIFGGEAVRGFAFAFTLGVFFGSYSSIAISAPLVWSGRHDKSWKGKPTGRQTEEPEEEPAALTAGV
ncbi:MAG: protein translocase subunit SecD [Phycisphaerales bacterium]|nr:protein translocase subunit SecD [Phycisphaerales bacterium]